MAKGSAARIWAWFAGGAAASAAISLSLLTPELSEGSVRTTLTATNRAALMLFLLIYVASPLHRLATSAASRWLMRMRRDLGAAFAGTQLVHLALVSALYFGTHRAIPLFIPLFGGAGFVLIAAMFVTTFARPTRWLGRQRWKKLHTFGVHYLFMIFAFDFVGGTLLGKSTFPYLPLALIILAAAGARFLAWRRTQPKGAARTTAAGAG